MRTVLEMNNRTLTGNLKPGANRLVLRAEAGDVARVTFGYRVPSGRLDVRDVASYGMVPGYERHVAVLDPARTLVLEALPKGDAAAVRTSPGIAASLEGGTLSIRATDTTPRVAWVALCRSDGGEYVVTLAVAPGAQLLTGAGSLANKGDMAVFPCDLQAGKYAVLVLNRFPSHAAFPWDMRAELVCGTNAVPCCCAVNRAVMLHKQNYGVKGGRAAWKWDFPLTRAYPYEELAPVDLPTAKELVCRLVHPMPEGPLEVGGLLVLPWPGREFRCELIKALCGLNYRTEGDK